MSNQSPFIRRALPVDFCDLLRGMDDDNHKVKHFADRQADKMMGDANPLKGADNRAAGSTFCSACGRWHRPGVPCWQTMKAFDLSVLSIIGHRLSPADLLEIAKAVIPHKNKQGGRFHDTETGKYVPSDQVPQHLRDHDDKFRANVKAEEKKLKRKLTQEEYRARHAEHWKEYDPKSGQIGKQKEPEKPAPAKAVEKPAEPPAEKPAPAPQVAPKASKKEPETKPEEPSEPSKAAPSPTAEATKILQEARKEEPASASPEKPAEAPKAEAPKAEAPKAEAPKVEAPKAEASEPTPPAEEPSKTVEATEKLKELPKLPEPPKTWGSLELRPEDKGFAPGEAAPTPSKRFREKKAKPSVEPQQEQPAASSVEPTAEAPKATPAAPKPTFEELMSKVPSKPLPKEPLPGVEESPAKPLKLTSEGLKKEPLPESSTGPQKPLVLRPESILFPSTTKPFAAAARQYMAEPRVKPPVQQVGSSDTAQATKLLENIARPAARPEVDMPAQPSLPATSTGAVQQAVQAPVKPQAAPPQAAPPRPVVPQAAPTQAAPTQAAPTQAAPTQAAPTQAAPPRPVVPQAAPVQQLPVPQAAPSGAPSQSVAQAPVAPKTLAMLPPPTREGIPGKPFNLMYQDPVGAPKTDPRQLGLPGAAPGIPPIQGPQRGQLPLPGVVPGVPPSPPRPPRPAEQSFAPLSVPTQPPTRDTRTFLGQPAGETPFFRQPRSPMSGRPPGSPTSFFGAPTAGESPAISDPGTYGARSVETLRRPHPYYEALSQAPVPTIERTPASANRTLGGVLSDASSLIGDQGSPSSISPFEVQRRMNQLGATPEPVDRTPQPSAFHRVLQAMGLAKPPQPKPAFAPGSSFGFAREFNALGHPTPERVAPARSATGEILPAAEQPQSALAPHPKPLEPFQSVAQSSLTPPGSPPGSPPTLGGAASSGGTPPGGTPPGVPSATGQSSGGTSSTSYRRGGSIHPMQAAVHGFATGQALGSGYGDPAGMTSMTPSLLVGGVHGLLRDVSSGMGTKTVSTKPSAPSSMQSTKPDTQVVKSLQADKKLTKESAHLQGQEQDYLTALRNWLNQTETNA